VDEARLAAHPQPGVLAIGYGPFTRGPAARIAEALTAGDSSFDVRLDEDLTPELLRRAAAHELAAAVVFETPSAARQDDIRVDALRDEPLAPTT
jgi:hypothetical protein